MLLSFICFNFKCGFKQKVKVNFQLGFFFFFFFSTLSVHCHLRQTGGVDGNCFQNIYLLTLEPPRSDC